LRQQQLDGLQISPLNMSIQKTNPLALTTTPPEASAELPEEVFSGGGELGDRIRAFDWSSTPMGPISAWPQSLKTAVRILITSRYAMWMGWGPDLTFLYNDAYAHMTLGKKHPWALGRPAREVWAEIWADLDPRVRTVLETGEATWDEGLLLFLERSGYTEETYHTFSYSPLTRDDGKINGLLCVVTEETERIIGERASGRFAPCQPASAQKLRKKTFSPPLEAVLKPTSMTCLSLSPIFSKMEDHGHGWPVQRALMLAIPRPQR
jgi:PAS fold